MQYESIGDKDQTLLPEDYLHEIEPYLSDIINNHKTHGEQRFHSAIPINSISSNDSDKTRIIDSKCQNIKIIMGSETDQINEEFFESPLQ